MRVFLLVVALALGASACLPPQPAPLENGRLPDSSLTTVTPQCRVLNAVAPKLEDLLAAAHADGVTLEPETTSHTGVLPGPPTIESCYRSYDGQVWWRNFYCFFYNDCGFAAVPGTSIHGWGRAVDFEDTPTAELTFASPGYAWLVANAGRFGFVHPAWAKPGQPNPEPWHWDSS